MKTKSPATCLPLIRMHLNNFTKSEQKIANFILKNPEEIIHMTIPNLAEATESGDATISRFCTKLGFTGLQGLKMALAGDIFSPMDFVTKEIQENDSLEVITHKIFNSINDALQDTIRSLDYGEIQKAIDVISMAKRLDVYGFGGSSVIAADVLHRFMRFGIHINALSDPHLQATAAALLQPKDVVLAISHTGASIDLLKNIETAKNNKAIIIVLTSYKNSSLTKFADICLSGIAKETKYRSEAMASRFIHLAILDIIYTGVMLKKKKLYLKNMNKMRQSIAKHKV